MEIILEPFVTLCQELNVTKKIVTIGCMDEVTHKQEFAKRLNEVCDDMGIPPKGENRQSIIGGLFEVTQKGARKWLEGESIPSYERCIDICNWAKINYEWLMSGHGQKKQGQNPYFDKDSPEDIVLKIMQCMENYDKGIVVKIITSLAKPSDND